MKFDEIIIYSMGYDIYGFLDLVDGVPKLPLGTDGNKFYDLCAEYEMNRSPVESFIGMKFESIITKISPKPIVYLDLYTKYKTIVKDIETQFNSNKD